MSKKPTSLKDLKNLKGSKKTQKDSAAVKSADDGHQTNTPTEKERRNLDAALGDAKGNQIKGLAIGATVIIIMAFVGAVFYLFSQGMAVKVSPDEAEPSGYVTLESGLGWVTDEGEVFVLGSNYRIGVHAEDFISQYLDITSETAGSFMEITLQPKPAQIRLTTDPQQEGTKWIIDSEQVSSRASVEIELEPGEHQLVVDHPYFEPVTQTLMLQRAEELDIVIPLSKVQGQISLQSAPANATVTINGDTNVVVPYAGMIEGGTHTVQIQAPGYVPIADQIEITNIQRQVQRNYRLQPMQSGIQIAATPATARITVDGRSANNGAITTVNANQNYSVEVSQQGYVTQRRTVRVTAGQVEQVSFSLDPATGPVSFISEPRGAEIYINGQLRGNTPLTLELQVLPTRVEYHRPGYRNVSTSTTPTANKPVEVKLTMQTELQARLREMPQVMRDSVGLELVRFKPDQGAFKIGAERGEIGQFANEILRTMQLNKYFYASKHEITLGQYRKFNASHAGSQAANMPVTNVTWEQAAAFCNWLSAQEGLKPFYAINSGQVTGYDIYSDGYRLPSESEWEWLARKSRRQQMTPYTWGTRKQLQTTAGNLADEDAKSSAPSYIPGYKDGYAALAPVGSFPAELSGLHDMSGNVREWVNDRYSLSVPSRGSVEVNFFGPVAGEGHVVKGSSFKNSTQTTVRAASRGQGYGAADDIGFRVVRYVYGAEDR